MSAIRIMVFGASGFIGPAVVRRIIARGGHPIAVSRTGGSSGLDVEALRLDRGDLDAVAAAVLSTRPDAVIDLLAYTARDTSPLLHRLASRVGRYVLASSGDVYRQYDLLHRRARGAPLPELREDAPLRTRLHPYRSNMRRPPDAPDAWMDDYDKIPIERALAKVRDLPWSVVRLPMVYGPGDRNRRLAWALGPMLRGDASLTIDAEWAAWRTSLGFVDDVAEALVLAAVGDRAPGRTFNAGPAAAASNQEWAAALADVLGWVGPMQLVPRDEASESMRRRLAALDLSVPLVLGTDAIRRTLGYAEVTPLDDALAATVAAERATG